MVKTFESYSLFHFGVSLKFALLRLGSNFGTVLDLNVSVNYVKSVMSYLCVCISFMSGVISYYLM